MMSKPVAANANQPSSYRCRTKVCHKSAIVGGIAVTKITYIPRPNYRGPRPGPVQAHPWRFLVCGGCDQPSPAPVASAWRLGAWRLALGPRQVDQTGNLTHGKFKGLRPASHEFEINDSARWWSGKQGVTTSGNCGAHSEACQNPPPFRPTRVGAVFERALHCEGLLTPSLIAAHARVRSRWRFNPYQCCPSVDRAPDACPSIGASATADVPVAARSYPDG